MCGENVSAAPSKATTGKVRHRWSKEIAEETFHVNAFEAKATVYWRKRQEVVILAGAQLKPEPALNKDGSLGFQARFGLMLRSQYADAIIGNHTTRDITVKSVNEMGLLLYFGGTNSWLQLIDDAGRTLDERTR